MDTSKLVFSSHCSERMKERNLDSKWILETINYPDEKTEISDNEIHFHKAISDCEYRWLKVVVNPLNNIIITAYFDRNKKEKI